jgi:pyruvate dehydrogenase (quinone)
MSESTSVKVPGLAESTEAGSVASFMLERLHGWGCNRIYGYPGDGINGFIGAFREVGDGVQFTQTRHEEIAAFCASAHAKFGGGFGVCMATSGPGAIHLLNGLYDAKLDHVPVVAIVGQQKRMSLGGHFQQEVDLPVLFSDVAGEYVHYCMAPTQAAHLVDRAVRIALSYRTVTAIIIPEDVQESEHQDPPARPRGGVLERRHHEAARDPPAARPPARRRDPQQRREGRDDGRPGCARGGRGGQAGRRGPWLRRGQGAQRHRRPPRRPAVR